ncbi:hypothetical protein V2A60_002677 [Cordyceps javanica]
MTLIDRLFSAVLIVLIIFATHVSSNPSLPVTSRHTSKYFREPGGSLARVHYDLRYFREEITYDERRIVLQNLIRSYLDIMQAKGVETWLAHGTLLGWWWNAQVMPWDYDLDVQVSNKTMAWLAGNLNGTQHTYTVDENSEVALADVPGGASKGSHNRSYLLDVNPHYVDRSSTDGCNLIDGRWVDVENGMYVDITVLHERTGQQQADGEWSCKNGHQYKTQDLWPLRATEFEGVPARIPHNVEEILREEYSQRSMTTEAHHHQWDHDLKQWVMEDPEQRLRAKSAAASRKKQQMENQRRL